MQPDHFTLFIYAQWKILRTVTNYYICRPTEL